MSSQVTYTFCSQRVHSTSRLCLATGHRIAHRLRPGDAHTDAGTADHCADKHPDTDHNPYGYTASYIDGNSDADPYTYAYSNVYVDSYADPNTYVAATRDSRRANGYAVGPTAPTRSAVWAGRHA